jgi:MFS family permease
MLGMARTIYAKKGKNIENVLFLGALGASVCYVTAALSDMPVIGLIACALTGFCVSMLWPGSLIIASERFPQGGVFIFAMMAAGGDLGASIGPQPIGIITDAVAASPKLYEFALNISLSQEQLGMKLGMLVAAIFPICAIPVYHYLQKSKK